MNIIAKETSSVFSKYYSFLVSKNVIKLGVALIISNYLTDLSNSFTSTVISPIISYILSSGQIKSFDEFVLNYKGMRLEVGKFIHSVLRFIIMTFILFIVLRMFVEEDRLCAL